MKVASMLAFLLALSSLVNNLVGAENIYEMLSTLNYTGFKALVDEARLDTIFANGELTLFVPSNEAVALASVFPEALGWYRKPENAIIYYGLLASAAYTGSLTEAELKLANNVTMSTAQNYRVKYNSSSEVLKVNVGTVSNTNVGIVADNGLLHETDRLISFPSLVEAISADPSLSLVFTALSNSPLLQTLFGGNITIFAPSTAAFISLGTGPLANLVTSFLTASWGLHLIRLLQNHFVPGFYFLDNTTNGRTVTSLADEVLTFSVNGDDISVSPGVDGSVVITKKNDVLMDGVVHSIAGLIASPFLGMDILMVAAANGYTEFVKFVEAAGLTTEFKTTFGITAHVPTNAAFNALGAATKDYLASTEGKKDLVKILRYHVINVDNVQLLPLFLIQVGTNSYDTLHTEKVNVTWSSTDIQYASADITGEDLLANNGLIREISAVVVPGDFTGPKAKTTSGGVSRTSAGAVVAVIAGVAAAFVC